MPCSVMAAPPLTQLCKPPTWMRLSAGAATLAAFSRAWMLSGRLIAFDRDPEAVAQAAHHYGSPLFHSPRRFSQPRRLAVRQCGWRADGPWCEFPQIDSPERGFSFRFDGPLDMRMDTTRGESVAQWLETAEVNQIAEVIREYGEERFAGSNCKGDCCSPTGTGPNFNHLRVGPTRG